MSKRGWGIIALLCSTFIWGVGPVFAKLGLNEMPPFSLAFLRTLLSLLILAPFVVATGKYKVKKADIPRLLLVGLFGSGLNAIFFLWGVSKTSASASSSIFATAPLVNAIAASLILRERPAAIRILGVIVGFLGSLLIALGPALLGKGRINGDVLGNFLIVASVFCWVAYIIYSKELLEKYQPVTIITFSILSGLIILLPLAYMELLINPFWYLKLNFNGLISILYGGIFSGVVAFFFFQWGLKFTSAFEAGMLIYLQPVLTDIAAVPILGEKLSPIFILGSVLILGGVFLATSYELIQKRR